MNSASPLSHGFWRCERGASAAEFAIILPVFLLFFFGIIDGGRFLYEVNQGGKAAQVGARMAVVTDPLAPQLSTQSYVGQTVGGVTLIQGDRIPVGALGQITCISSGCVCTQGPCPEGLGFDSQAFERLLNRTQQIMPAIREENLTVIYSDSGLGYAGNPNGIDIAPFVTVRIADVQFSSIILFGRNLTLPTFSYNLVMEDGQGQAFN
jgi:hypothetical protein